MMMTARALILLPFAIAAMLVLPLERAVASGKELQIKRSFGYRAEGVGHVQIRSILAPVKRSETSNRTAKVPVTPILTITTNTKVGLVCGLGPRVTDALLQVWYRNPLILDRIFDPAKTQEKVYRISKTDDQKRRDAYLVAAVNKAIGEPLVSDILVIKGVVQTGGGTITKLPFAAVNGCTEYEKQPAEGS